MNCNHSLENKILKRIESIGQSKEMLMRLKESPLFEDLSKNSPYWQGESEKESDKLWDIRSQLSYIEQKLYDIVDILEGPEEYCE